MMSWPAKLQSAWRNIFFVPTTVNSASLTAIISPALWYKNLDPVHVQSFTQYLSVSVSHTYTTNNQQLRHLQCHSSLRHILLLALCFKDRCPYKHEAYRATDLNTGNVIKFSFFIQTPPDVSTPSWSSSPCRSISRL